MSGCVGVFGTKHVFCIIDSGSRSQASTELYELHADSFSSEFAGPEQAAQRAASGNLSRVSSTDTSSSAHASMPGQQAQRPSKAKGQAAKAGRGRGRGQGAASSPSPALPMAVSHILQAPPRLAPVAFGILGWWSLQAHRHGIHVLHCRKEITPLVVKSVSAVHMSSKV